MEGTGRAESGAEVENNASSSCRERSEAQQYLDTLRCFSFVLMMSG